jgi:benzoylformate decarboxylase
VAGRGTGRHAVIEQFLADGIDHMFGNPGTVEQGFLDALADHPAMTYVLALQETVAVMAADGYARAARRPALVQLHSTPGVGNGIGALYQAHRGHSPLVVIGGDAGIRYQAMEAQMYGDLVGMTRPVTKWATMVQDPASLLRVIRRAVKTAATPPMGPVYVCLPADVMDAASEEVVEATSLPSTRVLPDAAAIRHAASLLAGAARPLVIAGDGVAFSGAQDELARVAETLGAEVWEADAGEVNISADHPLYRGATGHMFGQQSLPITRSGDAVLIVGSYVLPEVFPHLGDVFAPGARVIHIDLDTSAIAKNHRVDLGLLGDPLLTLAELSGALESAMTTAQRRAAAARAAEIAREGAARRAGELARDREQRDLVPLRMAAFAEELAAQLPADAIVFDEALTNSPAVQRHRPARRTGDGFLTRGGSLGVGFPGAIGVKLANPDRTVVALSGDGAAMYTIQCLWTAARHDVDATFVVCNNRSYRLLQANIDQYWKDVSIPPHDYPLSFDLSRPPLDFVTMARGMSVPGSRVERPDQIGPAIRAALGHRGPYLIDLVLEADVHPELIGVRCGQ